MRPTIRFSRRIHVVLILAAAALIAGCGGGKGGGAGGDRAAGGVSGGPPGAEGTAAPDFTLPDLEGRSISLADFKGKVVIVNFWATWCPPCRAEIPDFVRLQAKHRDKGLAIVGLSLDAGGARDVRPFAEDHEINYTMLIGNDEVARAYGGIVGIPTSFVLDREGRIVKKFVGYTDPRVWESTVESLLAPAS